MTKPRILFLGLRAFSEAGGIEKVNKTWLKALNDFEAEGLIQFKSYILLDDQANHNYIQAEYFKGFKGNKFRFFLVSLWHSIKTDQIVASHINLAPLLYLIKLFQPGKKIYLHAHGIEVWRSLNKIQKIVLNQVDLILAVSEFTKAELINKHQLAEKQIKVLPNALDPFFEFTSSNEKVVELKKRYQLNTVHPILFTLTRLSFAEQYKGYDAILKVLPRLINSYPNLQYLIGGKADKKELERIIALINKLDLTGHVQLLGYIAEKELTEHYQMADVYVMPSRGEGFGISFIEASACGIPVLAGNLDGSKQAVNEPVTGLLCNPNNEDDIYKQLSLLIEQETNHKAIQKYTQQHFGFDAYKSKIAQYLKF